jgi:hypothetical protein
MVSFHIEAHFNAFLQQFGASSETITLYCDARSEKR